MKLIIAIIKPFKKAELVDAVRNDVHFPGMTVHDVCGFGSGKTSPHEHERAEDLRDFTEHCACYIAAPDDNAGAIVDTINSVAHTGLPGDGKVLVLDLDDAIRIRTGETGVAALQ